MWQLKDGPDTVTIVGQQGVYESDSIETDSFVSTVFITIISVIGSAVSLVAIIAMFGLVFG